MNFNKTIILAVFSLLLVSNASAGFMDDYDYIPPVATLTPDNTVVQVGETINLVGVGYDSGSGINYMKLTRNGALYSSKECYGSSSCVLSVSVSESVGDYTYGFEVVDNEDNSNDDSVVLSFIPVPIIDDGDDEDIPEFSSITAGIALLGAGAVFLILRKSK